MNSEPLVFFGGTWMARYAGLAGDRTVGGGEWAQKHEVYNFAPHKGRYYGFVHPTGSESIRLERLGADEGSAYLDGVTVVWLARDPRGGTKVVGWYRNARVFRHAQPSPPGAKRRLPGGAAAMYYAVARVADGARVLDPDERTLVIPRQGPGTKGYSHVWYADQGKGLGVASRIRKYIAEFSAVGRGTNRKIALQTDPVERALVERAAVLAVWGWYKRRQYSVKDVQRDCVGWDLEARKGAELLRLEVKGLSGPFGSVELTANEWAKMNSKRFRSSYRLCVVAAARQKNRPDFRRYRHDPVSATCRSRRWAATSRRTHLCTLQRD